MTRKKPVRAWMVEQKMRDDYGHWRIRRFVSSSRTSVVAAYRAWNDVARLSGGYSCRRPRGPVPLVEE